MRVLPGIVLALFLAFIGCGPAAAQISDINSAINKAGRQRMLSQRMAKAYFQIGMEMEPEASRKILNGSVATFESQLADLKSFAPTAEIKNTYQKLEQAWLAYKAVLLNGAPARQNGPKVLDLSDQVLTIANQGTFQLEKFSGTATGHLVNISGRQRMLSQRMAKFYQAAVWGLGDADSAAKLNAARKEFIDNMVELRNAPSNTPRIKDSLKLVNQQWVFFEAALDQTSEDRLHSRNIATASERILQEMDQAVGLYEKLGPAPK